MIALLGLAGCGTIVTYDSENKQWVLEDHQGEWGVATYAIEDTIKRQLRGEPPGGTKTWDEYWEREKAMYFEQRFGWQYLDFIDRKLAEACNTPRPTAEEAFRNYADFAIKREVLGQRPGEGMPTWTEYYKAWFKDLRKGKAEKAERGITYIKGRRAEHRLPVIE